ncbi:MAG: hypothetical protein NVS4B7_00940 [Ktedonobacteraceae bacterium]
MSNLGATLVKITLLASGAILGALLARLYDESLAKQAEERSERDKNRYAQGLPPLQPAPAQPGLIQQD